MADIVMDPQVAHWNKQLEASRKREKSFRKDGRRVVAIYEAQKKEEYQFNILYSNTETLLPALYNNTPRPVVERRFKDADPLGKVASKVVQRLLEFLLDSNDQDYSNFDDMAKQAVLEALLPGRGVTRFKYDAEIESTPAADGKEATEQVSDESVCGEEVPWDRVLFGYAKKWKDVPWVALEHFFTKEELIANFGPKGATIPLSKVESGDGDDDSEGSQSGAKDAEGEQLAHVYEIWDKASKTVIFIAEGFGEVVKKVEDPLKLSGFFPIPRPLAFFAKVSSLCPVSLYAMYEEQAKELNAVTVRINKIVRALKVRGFYDSTLSGLDDLLHAADNTLLPAENVSAMLQGQTLEKAIWLMPLEKLITVLQQLYIQRTQIKELIYEITGISDILRGASAASETATAQNIKNQWGTLRMKRAQKEVQRYIRDSLRIMAEIAVTKLSPERIAAMTGMQFPTAEQKQQAQAIAQQLAAAQQPLPPDLQSVLSQPTWDDIMGLLQDDLQRNYRIDIETNSTVDIEATEDKAQVTELLNALAQFMNGIMPVVEQGIMSFDAAKAVLLSIVRRFRFGPEVEDQINAMQPPQPKADPNAAKAETDKAKAEMEMEALRAKTDADKQLMSMEMEAKRQEFDLKRAEMAMKLEEMRRKGEFAAAQHMQKMQQMAMQKTMPQPQGKDHANV